MQLCAGERSEPALCRSRIPQSNMRPTHWYQRRSSILTAQCVEVKRKLDLSAERTCVGKGFCCDDRFEAVTNRRCKSDPGSSSRSINQVLREHDRDLSKLFRARHTV